MSFGTPNKSLGWPEGTACFEMGSPLAGVQKHGDQSQAEDRRQGYIQLARHGLEDQDGITGAKAGSLEERSGLGGSLLQLGKGDDPPAVWPAVDDVRLLRAEGGLAG